MAGEPTHIALGWKGWCQGYCFHLNMPQLSITEKVKWSLRFIFTALYTVLQTKNTRRRASTINLVTQRKTGTSHLLFVWMIIMQTLQIDTLCCQQR